MHRILVALVCVFGFACVAEPDSSATATPRLDAKGLDFVGLFDGLIAAQGSQPVVEKLVEDPASVIEYSSVEELASMQAKTCDASSSEPPLASCAAAIAGEQTWAEKPNDGCTKRQYCKLSGVLFQEITATCRTCMTCCDVRNGQTTCRTSCTGEYVVR
ncbi:MAG: hypothetical protein H0T46_11260 [Deltaproteobacteria bacterium]|nr:hypothetical protein [Deltaproteobacteria bacterium]